MSKESKDEVPKQNSERNTLTSPDLVSSSATTFWNTNFGDLTIVKNETFYEVVESLVNKQLVNEAVEDSYKNILLDRIFCPDTSFYEKKKSVIIENFVDKYCVQFAINAFGPWTQIFKFIYLQLYDPISELLPINFFHGRISKEAAAEKLKHVKEQYYLLRYDDEITISTVSSGGSKKETRRVKLVLSYAIETRDKENIFLIKEQTMERKPKHKVGQKQIPLGWKWIDKVAVPNGTTNETKNNEQLRGLIAEKLGSNEIRYKPMMYRCAYDVLGKREVLGEDDVDMTAQKKGELNKAVESKVGTYRNDTTTTTTTTTTVS